MKKLLAIVIAAVMLAACSVTAFADTTTVSYDVDPSYTVSIPAAVTLGDADVTAEITASDVILEDGKKITVELTSASNTSSGSTFNAKNGDSTVTYTITGDEVIAVGDTVATFTADGSKTLTFSAADKSAVTVAGEHTETLTFGVALDTENIIPQYADQLREASRYTGDLDDAGFWDWRANNYDGGLNGKTISVAEAQALAAYQKQKTGSSCAVFYDGNSSNESGYDSTLYYVKDDGTTGVVWWGDNIADTALNGYKLYAVNN